MFATCHIQNTHKYSHTSHFHPVLSRTTACVRVAPISTSPNATGFATILNTSTDTMGTAVPDYVTCATPYFGAHAIVQLSLPADSSPPLPTAQSVLPIYPPPAAPLPTDPPSTQLPPLSSSPLASSLTSDNTINLTATVSINHCLDGFLKSRESQ